MKIDKLFYLGTTIVAYILKWYTTHAKTRMIPYDKFFKNKLDFNHIMIFNCNVQVHIQKMGKGISIIVFILHLVSYNVASKSCKLFEFLS